MNDFQLSFGYILSTNLLDNMAADIAQLLSLKGVNTTRTEVLEVLSEYDITEIEKFKDTSIALLLFYLKVVLRDNLISQEELNNVKFIKRLFGIREGDMLANDEVSNEVASIIKLQMELIYVDDEISKDEAIYKVNLQDLFGLNYDEFLKLTNQAALASMDRGSGWSEIDTHISVEEFYKWIGEKNIELDSSSDEQKSRHISQSIKDSVWNRDGGQCVQCGSNESLEFDHIIPFSKGGANTYRNVQLLCESCNRQKSDNIG